MRLAGHLQQSVN